MNWLLSFWAWIWGIVSFLPRTLYARFIKPTPEKSRRRKAPSYGAARVDELPERLQATKIYLVGERENLWAAAMICPCGCGDVIELNLLSQVRPCWSVQESPEGLVTLMPSVWRQKGCRSHFFLRRGRVEWCP